MRHGLDSDWDLLWAHEYPFRVLRDRLTRLGPHQKVLFVFLLRVPSGSNCLAWIVSGFVLKLEMFFFCLWGLIRSSLTDLFVDELDTLSVDALGQPLSRIGLHHQQSQPGHVRSTARARRLQNPRTETGSHRLRNGAVAFFCLQYTNKKNRSLCLLRTIGTFIEA